MGFAVEDRQKSNCHMKVHLVLCKYGKDLHKLIVELAGTIVVLKF